MEGKITSDNISFFFGAGSSAAFGIPTMKDMANEFHNIITKDDHVEKCELYNEVVRILKNDLGSSLDIEAIFSVIEGLKEYDVENIGELSLYASRKFFNDTLLNKAAFDKTILDDLETDFQRFVRKSCKLKSEHREKLENVYKNFFDVIGESVEAPHPSAKVRHDCNWTLFTTNYDRCLEAFWRENVQIGLDTGFRDKNGSISGEGKLQADQFLYTVGSKLQFLKNAPSHLRLVKLHGSVTWLRRKDTGEVEEKIFDIDQGHELGYGSMYIDEVVIYPLRQKLLYIDPYIQMFYLLDKELDSKRVWIVIGYSFRDAVIKKIFTSNFFKDTSKRMVLVDPSADEIVEKQFPDCTQRIKTISKEFGRESDYKEVNNIIANAVHH